MARSPCSRRYELDNFFQGIQYCWLCLLGVHRTRLGHLRQRCQVRIFQQAAHLESSNLLRWMRLEYRWFGKVRVQSDIPGLICYGSHLMFTQVLANFGKIDDVRNTLLFTTRPISGFPIPDTGIHEYPILFTRCNTYNDVTGNCNSSLLISDFSARNHRRPTKLNTLLSSSVVGQLVVVRGSALRTYSWRILLSIYQLTQQNTLVNLNDRIGFTYWWYWIPEWQSSTCLIGNIR